MPDRIHVHSFLPYSPGQVQTQIRRQHVRPGSAESEVRSVLGSATSSTEQYHTRLYIYIYLYMYMYIYIYGRSPTPGPGPRAATTLVVYAWFPPLAASPGAFRRPQNGPGRLRDGPRRPPRSQDGPRGPRDAQRSLQDAQTPSPRSKMVPRRFKWHPNSAKRPPRGVPRRPQEAKTIDFSIVFESCLDSRLFGDRTLQDRPRGPQDRPKTARDAPKTAPRRPKRPPKASQDGPRGPQDGPGAAQDGPRRAPTGLQYCLSEPSGPQEGPARPQEAPSGPQEAPRGPQTARTEAPRGDLTGPNGAQRGFTIASKRPPEVPQETPHIFLTRPGLWRPQVARDGDDVGGSGDDDDGPGLFLFSAQRPPPFRRPAAPSTLFELQDGFQTASKTSSDFRPFPKPFRATFRLHFGSARESTRT